MSRELLIYSRPGCHLCEDVALELEGLCRGQAVRLRLVDVDTDPAWREKYGMRIPVVAAGGEELSGYPLDPEAIRAWLHRPFR